MCVTVKKGSVSSFYLFIYLFIFRPVWLSALCLLIASAPLPGSLRGRGCELQMPLGEHANSRSRHGCLSVGGGGVVGGESSLRHRCDFCASHIAPIPAAPAPPGGPRYAFRKSLPPAEDSCLFCQVRDAAAARSWRGIRYSLKPPRRRRNRADAAPSTAAATYWEPLRKASDSQRD